MTLPHTIKTSREMPCWKPCGHSSRKILRSIGITPLSQTQTYYHKEASDMEICQCWFITRTMVIMKHSEKTQPPDGASHQSIFPLWHSPLWRQLLCEIVLQWTHFGFKTVTLNTAENSILLPWLTAMDVIVCDRKYISLNIIVYIFNWMCKFPLSWLFI